MDRHVRLLVTAPVVVLAFACAVALLLSARGSNPLWRTEPLNLSEAAALRDNGEVARLLAAGADPRAARSVRGGFLYEYEARLTPAEAAILSDRPELLQLLLDFGLSFDRDEWTRAWCTAAGTETKAVLERVRPPDAVAGCSSS